MTHDELTRHFRDIAEPALSPAFTLRLRRRLQAEPPGLRTAVPAAIRTWAARLYWPAAIAVLMKYWQAPDVAPLQAVGLGIAGLAIVVALHRALRPWPLTRVLRDALLR
jgi:hypothetical protein